MQLLKMNDDDHKSWACLKSLLKVLTTQKDSESQQNPYLASSCHAQAFHPMLSLACVTTFVSDFEGWARTCHPGVCIM